MDTEKAILAGGCFWGMEDLIRALPGVIDTTVGYTGGHTPNPTYEMMKSSVTGHAEALEVVFYPSVLPYRKLLEFFFQIHDPTTRNLKVWLSQFYDFQFLILPNMPFNVTTAIQFAPDPETSVLALLG